MEFIYTLFEHNLINLNLLLEAIHLGFSLLFSELNLTELNIFLLIYQVEFSIITYALRIFK